MDSLHDTIYGLDIDIGNSTACHLYLLLWRILQGALRNFCVLHLENLGKLRRAKNVFC
jgi:hypothetical protein